MKTSSRNFQGGRHDAELERAAFWRAWLIVAVLWFVACLNYFARFMITAMHGSMVEAFRLTEAQFGLLTSVFLWSYGLASPFTGFLADRFSRSGMVIISLVTWSLTTWLTAYAQNFEQLIVLRALMGVTEACYLPAALALIADYHRGPTRSLATGVHMTGIMIGFALSGLGGWLADIRSWRFAFVVVGIAGILYCVLPLLVLREAPKDERHEAERASDATGVNLVLAMRSLFSRGGFILALSYWGLLNVENNVVAGWLPTYMVEHFRLSQGAAGFSATAYRNIAALFGLLIGGAWADRWSRTNVRGRVFVVVIGLVVATPGLLMVAKTDILLTAILGLSIFGFAKSFSDSNMMPILCLVADRRYRATGYGLLNAIGSLTGGLAIYAAGVLKDRHMDISNVLLFAAACLIGCAVFLIFIKPQSQAE